MTLNQKAELLGYRVRLHRHSIKKVFG